MLEDNLNVAKTVDTSGMSCPVPLLKTKKALKNLKPGEVLKVISTDPGSVKDIPGFGNKGGNSYLGKTDGENSICHFIRKG